MWIITAAFSPDAADADAAFSPDTAFLVYDDWMHQFYSVLYLLIKKSCRFTFHVAYFNEFRGFFCYTYSKVIKKYTLGVLLLTLRGRARHNGRTSNLRFNFLYWLSLWQNQPFETPDTFLTHFMLLVPVTETMRKTENSWCFLRL